MKALLVKGPGDYGLTDLPLPEVKPGWALLKVRTAAFCATDLEVLTGGIPAAYPLIPGHEWCADVVEINDADQRLAGKRVVGSNDVCCLTCKACRSGLWRNCAAFGEIGFKYNGAYAAYMTAPLYALREVPPSISDIQACMLEPLGVALGTLDKAEARIGETLLIFGAGSIGLNVLAVAKAMGLRRITVVERSGGRLPIARAMGAFETIATASDPLEARLKDVYPEGADIIVDATGSELCLQTALALAPKSGRVVLAGYGGGKTMGIRVDDIHIKNLRVSGAGNNWNLLDRCLDLVADGLIDTRQLCTKVSGLNNFEQAVGDARAREPLFVKTVFDMGA